MESCETDPVAEWVQQAQAGDARAFDRVIEHLADRMWRSALVMCREEDLARDVVQEMWGEAWGNLKRFDGRCLFSTWLHGILRNRFLKALRRRRRKPLVLLARPVAETEQDETGPGPDRAMQQAEWQGQVRALVRELPDAQARVLEYRFFAGASLADIAVGLDCSEGTVKSRLHHALKKLRENPETMNLLRRLGE